MRVDKTGLSCPPRWIRSWRAFAGRMCSDLRVHDRDYDLGGYEGTPMMNDDRTHEWQLSHLRTAAGYRFQKFVDTNASVTGTVPL